MKIRGRLKATDPNVIAKATLDALISEDKNPAAVALGKLGGLKGGKVRADNMTPEQRSESARQAAKARWDKKSSS